MCARKASFPSIIEEKPTWALPEPNKMTSLANSLAGLSLLSGSSLSPLPTAVPVESRAVRAAKAQFRLPPVAPLWQQPRPDPTVSAILRQTSLIENGGSGRWPPDVATAFTAYQALEKLRALAQAATKAPGSEAVRQRFSTGLAELETWLAAAPGQDLALSFGRAGRKAESVSLPPAARQSDVRGGLVGPQRDSAIPGLTGLERFRLQITRPGASDLVSVNLAELVQPPTLDRIAEAFNQAVGALPMEDEAGAPILDGLGQAVPRYQSRFAVVRGENGGWGLELRSGGIEEVALRQDGASPAVLAAVTVGTADSAGYGVALSRFAWPDGATQRVALPGLQAIDTDATAVQLSGKDGTMPTPILARFGIAAAASDSEGFTYMVGTSNGAVGSHLEDGQDDLILVKLDSLGRQVWQRSLGTAGSAEGLAVTVSPAGDIRVGGTMTTAGGAERDLLVAGFNARGDELFLSQVRQIGDEALQGFTPSRDGGTFVSGRGSDGVSTLTRLDVAGRVIERMPVTGGQVRAIASAPNGDLLLLTGDNNNAAVLRYSGANLSIAPQVQEIAGLAASSLAVAEDGQVIVGGKRSGEGTVALLGTGSLRFVPLGAGVDEVGQLLVRGGELFVGGRSRAAEGSTSAFLARIDTTSASLAEVQQWGRTDQSAARVVLGFSPAGDSAVHRLGFNDGILNPEQSQSLVDGTALRAGDSFTLRVNGGGKTIVRVEAGETAGAFAARLTRLLGSRSAKATVGAAGGSPKLRIEPLPGQRIELLAGPDGRDALAKLGIAPGKLIAPPPFDPKAPRVRPGGHYGLDLAHGLSLEQSAGAKLALERIESAMATVRAGFRSLFWDDTKAAMAEGARAAGGPSPYQSAQLARYRDALARLGG